MKKQQLREKNLQQANKFSQREKVVAYIEQDDEDSDDEQQEEEEDLQDKNTHNNQNGGNKEFSNELK